MVGHRFLTTLVDKGLAASYDVTIFGEEPRVAYDRVYLSTFFDGKSAEDLSLCKPGEYQAAGFRLILGDKATRIDREAKTVTSKSMTGPPGLDGMIPRPRRAHTRGWRVSPAASSRSRRGTRGRRAAW